MYLQGLNFDIALEAFFATRTVIDHEMLFVGDALIPTDAGILDNYRVKRQLLHSW